MEPDYLDIFRLDLLQAIERFGVSEVVRVLSSTTQEAQEAHWPPELRRLAAALADLADKAEKLRG